MSSIIRSINIKKNNLPFSFSLKFSKENDGIRISIPGCGETLPEGVTHFSNDFKECLGMKPSVITKLENFVIECLETNPRTTMFELNVTTGYIKRLV